MSCPICLEDDAAVSWTLACGHSAHAECLSKVVSSGILCCSMCRTPLIAPPQLRALVMRYQDAHDKSHLDFTRASFVAPDIPWHIRDVPAECSSALFTELLRGTGIRVSAFMEVLVRLDAFVTGSASLHLWMHQMSVEAAHRAPGLVMPDIDEEDQAEWHQCARAIPDLRPAWEPADIDVYVPTGIDAETRTVAFNEFSRVMAENGYRQTVFRAPSNVESRADLAVRLGYTGVIDVFDFHGSGRNVQLILSPKEDPHCSVSRFDMNVCGVVLAPRTGFNWTNATTLLDVCRMDAYISDGNRRIRTLFDAEGVRRSPEEQAESIRAASARRAVSTRTVSGPDEFIQIHTDTMEFRIDKYKKRGFTIRTSIAIAKTF